MRNVVTTPAQFSRYMGLTLIVSAVFIAGCSSKTTKTIPPNAPINTKLIKATNKKICYPKDAPTAVESNVLEKIELSYIKWRGTPYRYGGTTRKGIDCSAFTSRVYREVFDRSLPRTTSLQLRTGTKVNKPDLNPGDLIFFKINGRVSHVGVYVFGGSFIHASTTKGVMKSHLSNPYWSSHYYTSRTHWR